MKNLNEIITKYGSPDILIDSWENEFEGYAIWEYEDYILWNDEGLYHSNKKVDNNFNNFQRILDSWKNDFNILPAVGFISYNFKEFLYPNIKFKNKNKKFPYMYFVKPKKVVKYKIEEISYKRSKLSLFDDLVDYKMYKYNIDKIKDELYEGNAYQINYTLKKIYECFDSGLNTYLALRNIVKPPYGYYIKYNNCEILSFSPELFFETKKNKIFSYPMKGTRGRSLDNDEDKKLKLELKDSMKDKAEHLMIVDLLRNDIGKISKYGGVKVSNMFNIKSFNTVHQMISCIEGDLKNNIKESDIIKALFPGGSITGAPKESAMKIIDKLENYSRDIYTGSIGYINDKGDLKFNIAIRTMTLENNNGIYPVGGGIVWDSDAEDEWNETKIKSKILSSLLC